MTSNIYHYLYLSIAIIASLLFLYAIIILSLRLATWRRLLRRKSVTLLLTPPASAIRSMQATEEFFNVVHGFRAGRSLKDKAMKREVSLSLEIDSTRSQGIRYLAQIDPKLVSSFHQAITAYLPQIKVAPVQDKLHDTVRITEFKQLGHYAFPLASSEALERHDPVGYLLNVLTKLSESDQIRLQLVITPVQVNEAALLARKILGNEDLLSHLSGKKLSGWASVAQLINKGLLASTDAIGEMYHGTTKSYYNSDKERHEKLQIAKRQRPARTLSAFELELMETIHRKLSQPLFRVSIRVAIAVEDSDVARERLAAIKTSLQSYSVPSYQGLRTRWDTPLSQKLRHYAFKHRLPALLNKNAGVLASSELASLYHFPFGTNTQTDNLAASLSRTLPAPVTLKQNKDYDVILGSNEHHGEATPIGLVAAERERHVYIIGGTGNGKTTMLQYAIVQDMQKGKGLAVVDPHGDMAETLLRHVPKDRVKDVVYFNPDDLGNPIGLNLLELTPGLTGNELLREKDLITESVISVFRKIFSDEDTGGHRIEYVLRNTIQTALTVPDATLFTVFDLLNDTSYRKSVIKTLEDKNLVNFWKNELGKAGDMQKVKMAAGITAKIGRFLFSASAKQILEQPKSTIDFEDIINSGKILICNFSKGLIGEDTSELFGITILAKLQLASLKRARIRQTERRPFYLYVDEFQNFATASFVQMLSESRKYKLFMVMAEQSTSQQKDQQMVSIILANVGTVICFRTGNPHDERLLLPLFSPYIEPGEISNLSAFNFYAKLSAVTSQEPLSGQTLLLESKEDEDAARAVIRHSQTVFANKQPILSMAGIETKPKPSTKKGAKSAGNQKSTKMLDMA